MSIGAGIWLDGGGAAEKIIASKLAPTVELR
jgi:hypothetical protein